jgi:phospholipid-transporting ATPase
MSRGYGTQHGGASIRPVDSYLNESSININSGRDEFYAGGGVLGNELDGQDYLDGAASGSGRGGFPPSSRGHGRTPAGPGRGFMTAVKKRLGMSHAEYSEMDLPLTEQRRRDGGGGTERVTDPDDDDDAQNQDFDIRKYYYKVFRKKEVDPATLGPRVVTLNDRAANNLGYKGNHISTTKYNVFTFVPKLLFVQFSKYANLFFLCTSAIQQVPNVSPTNRYTTIGTLMVVLCVSAVKELVEDVKRANADKELNNSKVQVLGPHGEFEAMRWVKVQVGDIVRVQSEEPFPADIVLLASSEPEGLCYIETANLDGETNLKIKQARPETAELVSTVQLAQLRGKILSEQPNSSLYTYDATLELAAQQKVALSPEQLLLRGATLRNTPWIHGVVVFTGHETKLMRNATAAPIKRTAVEHMINLQIVFLFSILLTLAIVSSIGNVIKTKQWTDSVWYLQLEGTSLVKLFFSDLLTYWILFSNLVPIRYVRIQTRYSSLPC